MGGDGGWEWDCEGEFHGGRWGREWELFLDETIMIQVVGRGDQLGGVGRSSMIVAWKTCRVRHDCDYLEEKSCPKLAE